MAEPEIRPEGGEVKESKLWFADKRVKSYKEMKETTPSGLPILEIELEDRTIKLTEAKFNAIKGYKKSDLTEARNRLVRAAGQKIYALLMEYGPAISEVDHILNEAVRLSNDSTEQAENILWGVDRSVDRTLLDVNNILAKNYAEKKNTKADDAAPERGGVDSADKEQG